MACPRQGIQALSQWQRRATGEQVFRRSPGHCAAVAALTLVCGATLIASTMISTASGQEPAADAVSFATEVRPILAARCFGCHQGAVGDGGFVMTDFEGLLRGGESGSAAVVPGKPDESSLLEVIATHEGAASMPPEGDPLSAAQYQLIERWIASGAVNDHVAGPEYSVDHPPVYSRPPLVSALDVSPDGTLVAVSGLQEVRLLSVPRRDQLADNPTVPPSLVRRLIGLSSRIAAIRFSPDGSRLAVAGGNPAEFGEIQIWNVTSGELELSRTMTYDTLNGISWSPDGKRVAFGATDSIVRAIDASSGEQVLYQGAHDDWVRDTVFSVDGQQLVSVGRDMSCKLIDLPTQRFIDNITSITPGVLKGGIAAVDRHPNQDVVVIGGSDGIPKLYRMNRLTKRVIGDDANLIREYPPLQGRINAVAIDQAGTRFAAASSLNGDGWVAVYNLDLDLELPDDIRKIVSKRVSQQSAEERQQLASYIKREATQISMLDIPGSAVYACDFVESEDLLVAAGSDGQLRWIDPQTGSLLATQTTAELDLVAGAEADPSWRFGAHHFAADATAVDDETRRSMATAAETYTDLVITPSSIEFRRPIDYTQIVIQARRPDQSLIDVTSQAILEVADTSLARVTGSLVEPVASGQTELRVGLGNLSQSVPISIELAESFSPNFIRDVNPVLTRLGCNAGTCHGSQGGKKGFKLSLRGYDPIYDIRAFTDELASRRSNLMAPAASLMRLKPTALVAHEGGQLIQPGDKYDWLIRKWIGDGAVLDLATPRVAKIELLPRTPVLDRAEQTQQLRVVATYENGDTVDVTREAVIEVGELETARVEGSKVIGLRRGEAPLLARYEGAFTSTTLTVMGDRGGYEWEPPVAWSPIDELVASKWKRLKIRPSELCDDAEFVRRVYLDLTGLPPSGQQVTEFLEDDRPTRVKRDQLVDDLVGNPEFVEHWSNKWADLLQVNRKYLGVDGARQFRDWLRQQVAENRPYDQFAHELLTASGSNRETPAASYFKIHRTPEDAMENTTHLFLATRFNCNKCHDHPFERWTQDQYYQTAAFFAQIDRQPDPAAEGKKIPGTAVEAAKPLYEIIADRDDGEMIHERTGETAEPEFPFEVPVDVPPEASRRQRLASWMTSANNPYFATSYVNRLWGYLMGAGLIEPLDDIRAGNPPSNPELLDHLTREFIKSGFDSQALIRSICKSRTYQLSVNTNAFNADDRRNYSHALARRLPAEVLFDSIHRVTDSELKIPGVPAGTRAAALPDSGAKLPSGFLSTLGRPARESVCECDRSDDLQLGSVLALVSGPDLARAISDSDNGIANWVQEHTDNRALIERMFLEILNRPATAQEIEVALATFSQLESDHQELVANRDARRDWFATEKPKLESSREQAMAAAEQELAAAIAAHDPGLLEREAAREAAIAKAQGELDQHLKQAPGFESWRRRQLTELNWHVLWVESFASKLKRGYERLPDRSVRIRDENPGTDVTTVTTATELHRVSALRLELLADPELPASGPGLADNGNFVLTEVTIEAAPADQPDQFKPVAVESVLVDFNQQGFPAKFLTDGQLTGKQGWATHPETGQTRWATFQLKPIEFPAGVRLRLTFHQAFDPEHQIGKFRIAVSQAEEPVGLSLSEEKYAQLAAPPASWADETRQQLEAMATRDDPRKSQLERALADASQAIALDPAIVAARAKFDRVSQPVPPDARLTELQRSVEQSEQQLKHRRLTAAQDLAWALINSPAFLFNH